MTATTTHKEKAMTTTDIAIADQLEFCHNGATTILLSNPTTVGDALVSHGITDPAEQWDWIKSNCNVWLRRNDEGYMTFDVYLPSGRNMEFFYDANDDRDPIRFSTSMYSVEDGVAYIVAMSAIVCYLNLV